MNEEDVVIEEEKTGFSIYINGFYSEDHCDIWKSIKQVR